MNLLAPFFDKAALGVMQSARGLSYDGLTHRLSQVHVGLRVSRRATSSPSGRAAAELTANLLARLYPTISIHGPLDIRDELWTLVHGINPAVKRASGSPDVEIVVGNAPSTASSVYGIAAARWSTWLTVGHGATDKVWDSDPNILGGAFAACAAVSAVFRHVFSDLGMSIEDRSRELSLLNYSDPIADNPSWEPVQIPTTHIIGLGAVGNAAVWAMQRLPLTGTIHLVDPESVTLGNLQRYVLTSMPNIGRLKVDLAAEGFSQFNLSAISHDVSLKEYLDADLQDSLHSVLVAVDSAETRIHVQASLPREIFNGWTDADGIGVSSHRYFGAEEPCLACLYRTRKPKESDLHLLAQNVGLPLEETLSLLVPGNGLNLDQLKRIEQHHGVESGALAGWEGAGVASFREEVICGGVLAKLTDQASTQEDTMVPLAHQSAMAGIALATEYLKNVAGLTPPGYPTSLRCKVSRPLPDAFLYPQRRNEGDACFCTDEDYIEVWRRRWAGH